MPEEKMTKRLAGPMRRALIKLAIGLTAIWVTIFVLDLKLGEKPPPDVQAEARERR